jgi:3-oxoacyl-[acyl-carrier-protein] synthase-3
MRVVRYERVILSGIGYELPSEVVTSEEIERRLAPVYKRLKLPPGRLELMSGIRERRFWDAGIPPSQMAAAAAVKAIRQSEISIEKIGCLVHCSVCRDFLEPATASVVHARLGLRSDGVLFDISNACLGVVNGLATVANMIELGQIEAGLVVAAENGKALVDATIRALSEEPGLTRDGIKASFASLTIGAGAAAVVLTRDGCGSGGPRLLGGVSCLATEHNDLCRGDSASGLHSGDPLMRTDSEVMMREGCALARRTWDATRSSLGWTSDTIDKVFCHQVGKAHRKMLYETLGIDPAKDFSTLEYLGNVGSASLPVTLAIGLEQGRVEPGDRVMLFGIGSGLNCVMLGLQW